MCFVFAEWVCVCFFFGLFQAASPPSSEFQERLFRNLELSQDAETYVEDLSWDEVCLVSCVWVCVFLCSFCSQVCNQCKQFGIEEGRGGLTEYLKGHDWVSQAY